MSTKLQKRLCGIVLVGMLSCGPTGPASPAGAFRVTVSGEGEATEGYAFPPAEAGEPTFVDGWEVKYDSVVAFIDKVTLSENPDRNPADQSQTGELVAQLDGPWVVDLTEEGPLPAKEMNGRAFDLGVIANQNKKGGVAFDATQKYAMGFDLTTARDGAKQLNGMAKRVPDAVLAAMKTGGYSVWMKGSATFKGGTACMSTNMAYDFNRLPKKVNFEIGFKAPVTFQNCINPELMPMNSKGVQGQRNAETTAQVTLHLDHPFWDALEEDAPLRFDLIAARKSVAMGAGPAEVSVTNADLTGLDFVAGTDAQRNPLPYRVCGTGATLPAGNVSYSVGSVPVNAAGGAQGLKDYLDYMTYNLSTMGHLNNDGLCFPSRNYPSPK
jgi:hypothetical protein